MEAENEIIEFIENLSIKVFEKYKAEYRKQTKKEPMEDEAMDIYEAGFLAWIFVNKMNRD